MSGAWGSLLKQTFREASRKVRKSAHLEHLRDGGDDAHGGARGRPVLREVALEAEAVAAGALNRHGAARGVEGDGNLFARGEGACESRAGSGASEAATQGAAGQRGRRAVRSCG